MKKYLPNEIKNIVLLGASGSGKTTLAEAMAFEGKVIDRRGSIEADSTLSDHTDIEHNYKRSIYPSQMFAEFNGYKLNIIDPPGSDDFCGGLFSAFKIADVGILVINAEEGFEAGTEIQARYARKHEKPIIFFVNKLDSEKASWEAALESMEHNSHVKPVVVQYPLNPGVGFNAFIDVLLMKCFRFTDHNGARVEEPIPESERERAAELHNKLVEAAAENDESLMELYFDKGELTEDEIRSGLKWGISRRDLIPVFCGSAIEDIGTKRLMEFCTRVAPGPLKAPNFKTVDGGEVEPKTDGPTVIFTYKVVNEPHLGEVSFFRVITGTLTEGMELTDTRNGNKEKITQIFLPVGKNRVKVSELSAGDIGCTVKLKSAKVNRTLATAGFDGVIEPIKFPEHRFRTAVKALKTADEEKLGDALAKAHLEDPTIVVEYSKELKQTIIHGQGEHHLNILKWRLNNDYKIDIEYFPPRIPYRETITKVAAADYRHKKQSGGAGQFGEVHIVIEPYTEGAPVPSRFKVDGKEIVLNVKGTEEVALDWGGKLVFYNCIVGGAIDARFIPAVIKGLMEKMEEGPLTGSYARDIRVALYDGKMHPVDSNEISFKLAARNAFKEAFRNAGPKIMEPIYMVEVLVPSDRMGDVMSDLQNRRAMIEGMTSEKGFELITARVPLAELYRYSTTLSSLSNGRASYTMKFHGYEQVPSDIQAKLLKDYDDKDDE
ncbi:MAG: elongation factor G [Rikenellaceae bacterium]|nr:elongation factor G [Rikenellaceae bacterium]